MRIKEVSALTGLAERTIRFYEEEGLFQPKKEYSNGRYYRNYSDNDIRDLKMLATLRQAGFSMDEIRKMQNEKGIISDTLTALSLRLDEQKSSAETMAGIIKSVSYHDDLSVYDLSEQISHSIEQLGIPKAEVQLRFGKLDGVDDAQRAAEYERFIKKRDRKRPSALVVLTFVLAFLVIVFSSLFAYNTIDEKLTAPPTSGFTEGWDYWSDWDPETKSFNLYRSRDDATELIYTESPLDSVDFSCYVGSEHLYAQLDGRFFSLNADGSGYHRIYAKGSGSISVIGEYGGNLVFAGPSRYERSILCVPISGGRVRNLLNNLEGQVTVENDVLFAFVRGKGYYAIDLYTLEKTRLGQMDSYMNHVIREYFEEALQ